MSTVQCIEKIYSEEIAVVFRNAPYIHNVICEHNECIVCFCNDQYVLLIDAKTPEKNTDNILLISKGPNSHYRVGSVKTATYSQPPISSGRRLKSDSIVV